MVNLNLQTNVEEEPVEGQNQLDLRAIELAVRNEAKLDMHLVECATARNETNEKLSELFKLVRGVGGKIIIGLFGVIGFLVSLQFGWL